MESVYSKIKTLWIKNFKTLENVRISFEDSNMIYLKADNEVGKSSIIQALGICAANIDPNEQKEWIKDGAQAFGVQIHLEDGTVVTRIKGAGQNGFNIAKDGVQVYNTNKITDGMPVAVKDVMGIMVESELGETLQIRNYEDNLLFSYTKGSTNHKMMYGAVKLEEIMAAIKRGNKKYSELKKNYETFEVMLIGVNEQLTWIKILKESELTNIKLVRRNLERGIKVLRLAEDLKNKVNEYRESQRISSAIREVMELESVECERLGMAIRTRSLLDEIVDTSRLADISEIEVVNLSLIDKIRKLSEEMGKTIDISKIDISKVEGVSSETLEKISSALMLKKGIHSVKNIEIGDEIDLGLMGRVGNVFREYKKYVENCKSIERFESELINLRQKLKDTGVELVQCPNCNEWVSKLELEAGEHV
jgi:hypothetical protein